MSGVYGNGPGHFCRFPQRANSVVQAPNIKEALQSRAFLQDKILSSLGRCFQLIGEKPVPPKERLHQVFVEGFRRELAEIQAPAAKTLFVLVKANHLVHLRIAEYMALIAMADISGHFGVGVLLERLSRRQARLRRADPPPNPAHHRT